MYKLKFDGQPVYDPRGMNETDRLIIVEPSVTLAVNAAGSVSFSIYPQHPMAGKITRMRGTLELEDDDGTIFRGRILKDETTFYGARKYTAEGALAFLNDAIVEPYSFPDDFTSQPGYAAAAAPGGNVVAWWLGWLLDRYNTTAPADRQIKLGTVTVKDPNNYITRGNSNYSNTWETISDKLVGSSLGGYVIVRYEDDGNYLDYLADLPRTNTQRVKFAQNLLDLIIEVTGENLFTAILPVGADGLTLAGLPDGPLESGQIKAGKVIYSPSAEAEYGGRITRVATWDDVTVAENLQTKAAAALAAGIKMPESITARACDLNGVDGVTPHFRVGQWVQVESAPHGIEAPYPLLELQPNILDPSSTIINLNTTSDKFTAQVRQAQVQAAENTRSAIAAASKHFNELVAGASGFYCTPDPQPGGAVIYYLHDKKTLAESTLVMKLTAEAIGFSTDGGSSYPYGFAINGEMVMRIIAAEGVSADWLKTGLIDLEKIKIKGGLGGLQQEGGQTAEGMITEGIVLYGPNGVDENGAAIPPYLKITNAGVQLKATDTLNFTVTNTTGTLAGRLRVPPTDENTQGGVYTIYESNRSLRLIDRVLDGVKPEGKVLIAYPTDETYVGGNPVYIGNVGDEGANPPYIIVKDTGIRLQDKSGANCYLADGAFTLECAFRPYAGKAWKYLDWVKVMGADGNEYDALCGFNKPH